MKESVFEWQENREESLLCRPDWIADDDSFERFCEVDEFYRNKIWLNYDFVTYDDIIDNSRCICESNDSNDSIDSNKQSLQEDLTPREKRFVAIDKRKLPDVFYEEYGRYVTRYSTAGRAVVIDKRICAFFQSEYGAIGIEIEIGKEWTNCYVVDRPFIYNKDKVGKQKLSWSNTISEGRKFFRNLYNDNGRECLLENLNERGFLVYEVFADFDKCYKLAELTYKNVRKKKEIKKKRPLSDIEKRGLAFSRGFVNRMFLLQYLEKIKQFISVTDVIKVSGGKDCAIHIECKTLSRATFYLKISFNTQVTYFKIYHSFAKNNVDYLLTKLKEIYGSVKMNEFITIIDPRNEMYYNGENVISVEANDDVIFNDLTKSIKF